MSHTLPFLALVRCRPTQLYALLRCFTVAVVFFSHLQGRSLTRPRLSTVSLLRGLLGLVGEWVGVQIHIGVYPLLDRLRFVWIVRLSRQFRIVGCSSLTPTLSLSFLTRSSYTSRKSRPAQLQGISSSVFGKNVVLCPMSFNPPAYGGKLHTLASLSNTNYPTAGNSANGAVDAFAPRSSTLYHELFHLTVGDDQAPDFTMDIRKGLAASISGSNADKTSITKNPESYVWFSLACWDYQNAPAGTAPVVSAGPDGRPQPAKMSPSD